MIVSWKWLQDYLSLDVDPAEAAERLAMAGLNHESTTPVGADLAIDLEVTSNRPDCLNHLGVARELAVLYRRPLAPPKAEPPEGDEPIDRLVRVEVACPDLCPRYTARLIRGVRIGPSPEWMVERLRTVGLATINNVVDATNYVLMECGQPLHAFDFAQLRQARIVVRRARAGEQLLAIDHRTYELAPEMCVIADADRPVAIGGVMGGAETEVTDQTTDVLIEAAAFAPLSIRTTARQLRLHSPSSYRFERGVDVEAVDWASRRCCQLILATAGGQLCRGMMDVAVPPPDRPAITLRLSQLPRILGVTIPADEVRRILRDLGCQELSAGDERIQVRAPSWRRDLTREIDLVEEAARIHGYEAIPDDAPVSLAPAPRRREDRVLESVRAVLTAAGLDEAMTSSVTPAAWAELFQPWTRAEPLRCSQAILKGADRLRCALVPSLLDARRRNEALGNPVIELFEIARVYLPQSDGPPREQLTLGVVSGGDYYHVKGVLETLVRRLNRRSRLESEPDGRLPLLDREKASRLSLDGRPLGVLGELAPPARRAFSLRGPATAAELRLDVLIEAADLAPQYSPQSPYPAIARDVNVIVPESVRWADLADTVRRAAGPLLERLEFREIYRDPQRDGPGVKRLLFSFALRAADRTLTNEEADQVRDRVVEAVGRDHQGRLLGR